MSETHQPKPRARQAIENYLPVFKVGEPIYYKDLASVVEFDETTVSGVLSEMVRQGLIARVKGKRGTYARIETPAVLVTAPPVEVVAQPVMRYTLEEYRELRRMVVDLLRHGGDKRQGSGIQGAAELILVSGVLDMEKLKAWYEERVS